MSAAAEYTALVASPRTRWQARCPDCGYSDDYRERSDASAHQRRHACENCDRMLGVSPVRRVATDGGTSTSGTDQDTVTVERAVLQELVETAKGKVEADVSRFGSDATGYDVDEFAETIKAAERSLRTVTEQSSTGTDRDVRTDGGHVRTSDTDLASHEHANALEAALDYVMEAARRARAGDVAAGAVARLQLAECGTRLAFFATSEEARTVGLHDATEHLEAALERIDEDSVSHPARHALQLFAGYEDGDQQ